MALGQAGYPRSVRTAVPLWLTEALVLASRRFGAECVGCARRDNVVLCGACRRLSRLGPSRISDLSCIAAHRTVVHTLADYRDGPETTPVGRAVGRFKYGGDRWTGRRLATLFGQQAALLVPEAATLVPVPAAPDRLATRGFDTAGWLSRGLARTTGAPLRPLALARRPFAGAQVGRGRLARLAAAQETFSAREPLRGPVVLIDDVVTTGATLAACVDAAFTAGASAVTAIALLHVPDRQQGPR